MNVLIVVLMCVQIAISLVELAVTLDRRFKQQVEMDAGIPEPDREP